MNGPEVLRVADEVERLGLTRNAARLRLAVAAEHDPERVAPVQEPSGGQVHQIPWGLHALLWEGYGHNQSAERIAERGGFGRGELGQCAVGMYGHREGTRSVNGRWTRTYPILDLYLAARGAGIVP